MLCLEVPYLTKLAAVFLTMRTLVLLLHHGAFGRMSAIQGGGEANLFVIVISLFFTLPVFS